MNLHHILLGAGRGGAEAILASRRALPWRRPLCSARRAPPRQEARRRGWSVAAQVGAERRGAGGGLELLLASRVAPLSPSLPGISTADGPLSLTSSTDELRGARATSRSGSGRATAALQLKRRRGSNGQGRSPRHVGR
ncbi:unnamed protein product [Urochloa humidicola]